MTTADRFAPCCSKIYARADTRLFYSAFKRVFDLIASAAGIILLLPVFLLIACIVKHGSPGPVFFRQNRVGRNGRVFVMLKFRTMENGADSQIGALQSKNFMQGNMFKVKNDPRITKNGLVLRRTSLDELPQLFNVLRGDMSLVGPRPPLVREYIGYEGWHTMRLTVKPGMTGLWQISGRNSVHFHEMLELDFRYIRKRGFFYDLEILFRTLPLLLGDDHAY